MGYIRFAAAIAWSAVWGATGAWLWMTRGEPLGQSILSLPPAERFDLGLRIFEVAATSVLLWIAAAISARLFTLEDAPVLLVQRSGGELVVRNVGRGVALSVFVQQPSGRRNTVTALGSIASLSAKPLGRRDPKEEFEGTKVFARTLTGRWWLTQARAPVLSGSRGDVDFECKVQALPRFGVPYKVIAAFRREARPLTDSLGVYGSWWNLEGFNAKLRRHGIVALMTVEQAVARRGQERLLKKYSDVVLPAKPPGEPKATREKWPLDVSHLLSCYHTSSTFIEQYSCQEHADGWLAHIEVNPPGRARVHGLLFVSGRALPEAVPKAVTDELLQESVAHKICALNPADRFVVEITSWPPPRRRIAKVVGEWLADR